MVSNVSVKIESNTSVTVSWVPPEIELWNGIVSSYGVIYKQLGPVGAIQSSTLPPFQTASIPQPGLPLLNNQDPRYTSSPLQRESVLIEELEEYYYYSFEVYIENVEGKSGLSDNVTIEMPQAGMYTCLLMPYTYIVDSYIQFSLVILTHSSIRESCEHHN